MFANDAFHFVHAAFTNFYCIPVQDFMWFAATREVFVNKAD